MKFLSPRLLWQFSRSKKALLAGLFLLFAFSLLGLFWNFYKENTNVLAADGGSLTEGAVATVDQNFLLNPLLLQGNKKANSVEADIARLVFSGLMKYDSATGEISDDLASHTLSVDKRTYTFTLKENLTWQDGEVLTADDVLFTYATLIQDANFPNQFLRTAFANVAIKKIDERTISFTLPTPYKFFLTNFTVGLVPEHALSSTAIADLLTDPFNQNPIGAGPYRFMGINYEDNSPIATLSLEAFPEYAGGRPHIDTIDFKLFPTEDLLTRNIGGLDALRPKLKSQYQNFGFSSDFKMLDFTLPQYVAVFINMSVPKLEGDAHQKVRLALQLATDKNAILQAVPGVRIDTPLLETNTAEWFYEFNPEGAAGALKDSGWFLPGKMPVVPPAATPPAVSSAPVVHAAAPAQLKYIYEPSKQSDFWTTTTSSYIVGGIPAGTTAVKVNGYGLKLFNPAKGRFSYKIDTALGTLKIGENSYHVEFFKGTARIDEETMKIHLVKTAAEIPGNSPVPTTPVQPPVSAPAPQPQKPVVVTPPPVASTLPADVRRNTAGEPLSLRLVTISEPEFYPQIANLLKEQWAKVGVVLNVEVLPEDQFLQKALNKKDYDLLLYGQSLGYNLDAYPFWHFSQADAGSNLSKYKSFQAGVLLEEIRQVHDEAERTKKLAQLQALLKKDVPAVFLLSPYYTVPLSTKVANADVDHVAWFSDRFGDAAQWYLRNTHEFKEGENWWHFFPWFAKSTKNAVLFQ